MAHLVDPRDDVREMAEAEDEDARGRSPPAKGGRHPVAMRTMALARASPNRPLRGSYVARVAPSTLSCFAPDPASSRTSTAPSPYKSCCA